MPKIVRTTDNDYRIITARGGTIYLDTTNALFDGTGKVVIRGDLEVKGDTTTVNSTITNIADNILVLNEGNTNSGLPASLDRPYSSGIQIDRGLLAPSRWIYDETITWTLGGTSGSGTWLATQGEIGSETILPLRTPGIVAGGTLYISTGNGIISVTGTNDYEEKIWNYSSGAITPDGSGLIVQDDDNIPNAKAVVDIVDYKLATVEISQIAVDDTKVEIIDKNNVIAAIDSVGSLTIVQTAGTHSYEVGDSITIQNVATSPTDALIEGINGTWTVVDVPARDRIQFNKSTTGGDANSYVANSGTTVSTETSITVTVENNEAANFYSNRIELGSLEIKDTQISTFSSNESLILSAPGTGTVKVKDTLELTKTPGDDEGSVFDPTAPLEGIKIYSKTPGTGKTGIYFVNEDSYQDEVISKNRALLYGMLF